MNSYNTPYKFNSKELDDETGYYYYGARYYNPRTSIWLNVDPLFEKFPGRSPYEYTFSNPVIYNDPDGKEPTPAAYQRAASKLGVPVAAIRAIYLTETGGSAYNNLGYTKILYERHYFHRFTNGKFDSSNPTLSNKSQGGYGKDSQQYVKLADAIDLDQEAAFKSVSWGGFQIMGEFYKEAGFNNVNEFANAMMSGSEDDHLGALVNFIINDKAAPSGKTKLQALKDLDWKRFARNYNGPDYDKNNYDTKMSDYYDLYKNDPFKDVEKIDKNKQKHIQNEFNKKIQEIFNPKPYIWWQNKNWSK